jgi:Domain of unknown function (DUF1707)/Cell wall-active antibiotics response 4TMS YvqF
VADPPAMRASDAEREATMERLREAAGAGRLTLEELADRIDAAGEARSRGELETLTRDLPPEHDPALAHLVAAPSHVGSVFGDVQRHGRWVVPARSSWRSIFGDVVLDLREAHVPAALVEIEAQSVFGDVDLLVPEGVAVEVRGRAVFGDVCQDAGQSAGLGAPRVVLSGGTVFGDVRVRTRRLREALMERVPFGRLLSR